jgi:serine/threonine-protein kinase RsbW
VIREGLTNAVRHGNNCDVEKLVRFSVFLEKSSISFTIEDQGAGFDWKNMDVSIRKPDMETGRGLWIIREYAHEYEFNPRGNILYLKHMIERDNF